MNVFICGFKEELVLVIPPNRQYNERQRGLHITERSTEYPKTRLANFIPPYVSTRAMICSYGMDDEIDMAVLSQEEVTRGR